MTIATNEIIVLRTSEQRVTLAINGENKSISWDDLVAAARQADPGCMADEVTRGLALIYRRVLDDARRVASTGPVIVSVEQDETNVWYVCRVRALYGGGESDYRSPRDEGGTHPNWLLAACEAERVCDRLGSRVVRRDGFSTGARARAAAIVAR